MVVIIDSLGSEVGGPLPWCGYDYGFETVRVRDQYVGVFRDKQVIMAAGKRGRDNERTLFVDFVTKKLANSRLVIWKK